MIRIKFEVEEQEETLPIESINVGFPSDNNVVVAAEVPNKVVPKKKSNLDNSTTDSVAVGSRSIKTEPAESLSEFTIFQLLNHPSLNIPGLLIQNCSQFQTIDSEFDQSIQQQEQSIPNGTEQFVLLPKIERIVSEIHQEVLLSLNQCSLVPNGTQQQQQPLLLPKIERIVSEIHQEVQLSLDQCSLNSNSMETTTTNCDTTGILSGPRAGLGLKAKSNVCYSVPMELEPVPRRSKKEPSSSSLSSADNSESTNNDIEQHSGSLSGPNSFASTSPSSVVAVVAAPSRGQQVNVTPEPIRWKHLGRRRKNESEEQLNRRLERKRQYNRSRRERLLDNGTPEQREQFRLKERESFRRQREMETEEQRKQRLEREKQYYRTVRRQRMKTMTPEVREKKTPKPQTPMTPEEREKKSAIQRKYYCRSRDKKKMLMLENKKKKKNNSLDEEQTSQSMSSSLINFNNFESSIMCRDFQEVVNLVPLATRRSRLTIIGYPLQC